MERFKRNPACVGDLPERYLNLFGLWSVSTEGDEEGRSTRRLGIYRGWVDEIAFHLADKCYYCLEFSPVIVHEAPFSYSKSGKNEVNVSFDIQSETWGLAPMERAVLVKKLFEYNKRDNVHITNGQTYGSFVISNYTKQELQEKRRQEALKKLTEEDKKVLGLI